MRKLLILLVAASGILASCAKTTAMKGQVIASTAVSSAAGSVDALIQAQSVWYARSLSGWIRVDESYRKGQSVVTLEYDSNRSMEGDIRTSRLGLVVVCTHDGRRCDTLKIYQAGMIAGGPMPSVVQGVSGEITAEFPSQPALVPVEVKIAPDGAVVLPCSSETDVDGCRVYSLENLRIVTGDNPDVDTLVEDTFWQESGSQWIYALKLPERSTLMEGLGFADCLRVFSGEDGSAGLFVYASANVFDRITGFTHGGAAGTGFTVYLQEE